MTTANLFTVKNFVSALAVPCALVAAGMSLQAGAHAATTTSASAASASSVEDTAKCRTRATTSTGKRDTCSEKLEISAPDGGAIDPASVAVEELESNGVASCSAPKLIYDGSTVIGATAIASAKSDLVPGRSGRGEIECRLSGSVM